MNSMVRTAPSDSLVTVLDSLGFVDFRFVQTSDTTYDGPAMVIRRDSLAVVADSLTVLTDTLPEKKNPQNTAIDGAQPSYGSAIRRRLVPTRDTLIMMK